MTQWASILQSSKTSLMKMENELFNSPELGFKEQKTREIILKYLKEHQLDITEDYGLSGFRVTIGSGKPHIALIAEMDALIVHKHPNAGPDGAAHACGHHLQTAILSHVLTLFHEHETFNGTLSLYCIAAEEFVDLDFRLQLQAEGKIKLLSGKQNLILMDAFKDVDAFLSVHTMGETSTPSMEINASLSGFIYKKLNFYGQAAHAAVMPHKGINALNAQLLTQQAFAYLRETFQEEDRIRLHLITTQGGESVNSVPAHTILEGYVRSINPDTLITLNARLNETAKHCALAMEARVEIEDRTGYMPLLQSRELNALLLPHIKAVVEEKNIIDHQKSFAAGDMGDLSLFKPTIQLGFSGCKGLVHGMDFRMDNADEALIDPAYVLLSTLSDVYRDPSTFNAIVSAYPTKMTCEEYEKMHAL